MSQLIQLIYCFEARELFRDIERLSNVDTNSTSVDKMQFHFNIILAGWLQGGRSAGHRPGLTLTCCSASSLSVSAELHALPFIQDSGPQVSMHLQN